MRVVIQRVSEASVTIEGIVKADIGLGLLILVGIEDADNEEDIQWLCQKIVNLRIFSDAEGLMNLSVQNVAGELLVVSQFTLFASTKKGNRPSYLRSAKPDIAIPMYEKFVAILQSLHTRTVQTGEFGADMKVALLNDGPVTIVIDTKEKE
jgi:D-tyrosyl-tRNA(Tyr) deacylase